MRRNVKKNSDIIISLIFVAVFTGASFLFDQLVIQQQNNIRIKESVISDKEMELKGNLFLLNSIINVSKDLSYSSQIKKNTLDDVYSRRSLFNNPDYYHKFKDKILLSGVKGFEKHKNLHDQIYINVLNNHNKKNDLVKSYIEIYKKNDTFLKAIESSEFDVSALLEDFDKYYFTKDEIKERKSLNNRTEIKFEHLASNKDPLYILYSNHRKKLNDLGYMGDLLYVTAQYIGDIQVAALKGYESNLFDYSKIKNKKNFYILLSIIFQILGLASLMLLFKFVINKDKK